MKTYPHPEITEWIARLKLFWKDWVAKWFEKQVQLTLNKWWAMYHIAEGIQKELDYSLQKDIDNHQDIQAMTWELKEVIDTMTLSRMPKEKIIYTLRKVLDKYEWEWREPLFLTNIQPEQIKPL
jgi:hypothetical protein